MLNKLFQTVIPKWFFSIRRSSLCEIFVSIYSKYLWMRYKENYYYWFNHFNDNEFLFTKRSQSSMNYSNFLFALFMIKCKPLLRRVYDLYGLRMLTEINIQNVNNRLLMYIVFLYHFDKYMPFDRLATLLPTLMKLPNNVWEEDRLKAYCKHLLRTYPFERKNDISTILFIMKGREK